MQRALARPRTRCRLRTADRSAPARGSRAAADRFSARHSRRRRPPTRRAGRSVACFSACASAICCSTRTARSPSRRASSATSGEPGYLRRRGAGGVRRLQITSKIRRLHRTAREPGDSLAPFAAARGILGAQVVAAAPGMRVEIEQRLRFLLQALEQRQQHDVLVHVREVAGVEGMTIVHDGMIRS